MRNPTRLVEAVVRVSRFCLGLVCQLVKFELDLAPSLCAKLWCGSTLRTYTSFVSVNRVLHDDFGDTPVEVLPPSRFASERKLCIERFACDAEAYNGSFEVCRNLIHRLVTLEVGHRTTITGK